MTPKRYSPEGVLSALLLIVLSLVIFLQIAGRLGVFPGQVWTEELIRWLWVWMACLGFSEADLVAFFKTKGLGVTTVDTAPFRAAMKTYYDTLETEFGKGEIARIMATN